MKKIVWTLGMLALSGGLAMAQDTNELKPTAAIVYETAGQSPSALDKALIANENKINDAVAKSDKAAFTALVVPDAWSLDGNGAMKVSEFAAMLDQVKVKTWKITDEKVMWVDPNTAIVTYKWTGSGTFQGQAFPGVTYASTVWTKKGDKWLAVFHQESEAAKPAPKPAAKK
jgi:ketosteroid isomerase-like protein